LSQALEHFQRAGDAPGQAWAHLFAALACSWEGDWAEGVTHCGQALALFRQAGDRAGQGLALAGLGNGHAHLGTYTLARKHARQALAVVPEAGDPMGRALAWDALGLVHCRLGEYRQAISCYQQALTLVAQAKTPVARKMLARQLTDFGDACRAAGDLQAAVEAWQHARRILDDLRLPDSPEIRARLERAKRPSVPS